MRVGDRVKHIYPPYETGTIIAIGDWDYDFNPYKIMVELDGENRAGNFKESHLKLVKEGK